MGFITTHLVMKPKRTNRNEISCKIQTSAFYTILKIIDIPEQFHCMSGAWLPFFIERVIHNYVRNMS